MKNKLMIISKIFLILSFIYYFWYIGVIFLNHLYMIFNMSQLVITFMDIIYLTIDILILTAILFIIIKVIKLKELKPTPLSLIFCILLIISGITISRSTIIPNILLFIGILILEVYKYNDKHKVISKNTKYFKVKKKQ
jgi:hypothetical protein